jgi:hypothetical protein
MAPPNGRVFAGSAPPSTKPSFLDNGVDVIELHKPLIIVIAVLGLAGSSVVLALLFKRFIHPKSSPLPPKQPLAHHRERESKYLPHPYFPRKCMRFDQVDRYGSYTSSPEPSRMPSFRTVDSSITLSPNYHSFRIPTLPRNYRSGELSVESNSDDHITTQHYMSTTRLARSASPYRSRSELSHESSVTSTRSVSTRSINTIRGAPHSPYSNIEIVLPEPMAPQLRGHMIADPSAIQSDTADRWMASPIRTTSWHPRPDRYLSMVDASPRREATLGSGQQDYRLSDNMDQLRRPGSRTQPKMRTSSRCPIQRRSLEFGDPVSSSRSPDNQIQPFRVNFRDPRDGQGTLMSAPSKSILTELAQFAAVRQPIEQQCQFPDCANASLCRQSRSFPRHNPCPSDTSNFPFPKSAAHPRHRYEQPPPPVLPLPRLSQNLLCKPGTRYFSDGLTLPMFLVDPLSTRVAKYPTIIPPLTASPITLTPYAVSRWANSPRDWHFLG